MCYSEATPYSGAGVIDTSTGHLILLYLAVPALANYAVNIAYAHITIDTAGDMAIDYLSRTYHLSFAAISQQLSSVFPIYRHRA